MRITLSIISGTMMLAMVASAQTPPDFSGVYYPLNPFGGGRGRGGVAPPPAARGGPPPRPTQSAPLSDGSQGRTPNEPLLTPEYMAKWETIRKTRIAGSAEYDLTAKCLPPGMPAMMGMPYGMEILQTKDKITFFSELNDALRRVYLDGRKPSAKVLDDPTYAGYSTGRWEGDTLVVDTVALNDISFVEGFTPHSDQMTVHERIRFTQPGLLEDRITVNDPKAFTKPWETMHTYRRAGPGADELREFACPEGLGEAK
ncbi:MAG TPA: hypothetical protein VK789_33220 [Bryobacteraceae bacterium]|jgi:hypothetical protein|nr:hypothetical protein [Bryobacteraceae bacterium]